ncbi:MAG: hypothetical protein HY098_02525 [Nitrospinae bacterium]|nr:hypothetical protein [Nitrospinota bacterium]
MQIKLSWMKGVPDVFKASPIKVRKPAGKLKDQQGNIQRMQCNARQETRKGLEQMRQWGKTPKGGV